MIEQLFGSKTRAKLLQLFYSNPNRSFYVREITRKIDEQINSVRRELSNLLSIGIIKSDANNNRLYYEVNQEYEHYQPLAQIFGGLVVAATPTPAKSKKKGASQPEPIKKAAAPAMAESENAKALRETGRVDLAVFTGQLTRDERSSTDVLIVGDVNQTKIIHFIEELERQEGKELAYTTMKPDDFQYRLQIRDRFLDGILAAKKQIIINDLGLPLDQR